MVGVWHEWVENDAETARRGKYCVDYGPSVPRPRQGRQANRDAARRKILFQLFDAVLVEVKDRRGQRGVGAALGEDLGEVLERARTARGNHGDVHGGRDGGGELAVEAALRAVAIDGGEQDLARASLRGFAGPIHGTAWRLGLAAPHVHRQASILPLRVDGHDHRLAAVAVRQRGDERRVLQRRRVQAHLVRARLDGRRRIVLGADAAADAERQEDFAGDGRDGVGPGLARFDRRSDVEDDDLVDALHVVAACELGRVAGLTQTLEVDAFDDASVTDVETGDDALGEHYAD